MLLGTMTKLPDLVRSFVARQVTSATRPSNAPTWIQWPTWNGFSLWMASPANAFPSVSWSAKPMTTALTAEVVSSVSCQTNVATTTRLPMTMKSWRMFGKRSGTRSARSGLMKAMTSRLMTPAAKTSRSNETSCASVSGGSVRHSASPTCTTTYAPSRKTESLSLRLTSRLTDRPEIASVAASAATPSIKCPRCCRDIRRYAIPFLNSATSAGVTGMVSLFGFEPPLASRSGTPPRAPAEATVWLDCFCSLGEVVNLPRRPPFFFGSSFLGSSFLAVSVFAASPPVRPRAPAMTSIASSGLTSNLIVLV